MIRARAAAAHAVSARSLESGSWVGDVDPERLEIRALADNEPIVPNDSWENRAKNRRVEISVLHGNRHPIKGKSPADNVDYVDQPDS